MERIIKAATVTATTDRGEFTAIAAAYSLDRAGDEIIPGAFGKTISKWQASGKQIPLHWNHSGAASDIIGSIDPSTLQEVDGLGLQVAGRMDLAGSGTAKEAWRSMKNGSMSLSFGYMVVQAKKRKSDGVQELHELDLFEISIVPVPANPDTKILSMKGDVAAFSDEIARNSPKPSEDEQAASLRKQADEVALSAALGFQEPPATPQANISLDEALMERLDQFGKALRDVNTRLDAIENPPVVPDTGSQRKQADTVALSAALGFQEPPVAPRGTKSVAEEVEELLTAALQNVWARFDALEQPSPPVPEAGPQRKQADEVALSAALGFEGPPTTGKSTKSATEEMVELLAKELQEVKARLDTFEKALEDQKKVDVTDKGPNARSVDPLRKQAEETALAVALGFERPPTPERRVTVEPDLMDLVELKQRSRDLMLQVLSGVEET